MTNASRTSTPGELGQRVVLAVVGGYFLSAAAVTLAAGGLSMIMVRSEAVVLSAMCGFPLYLALLVRGFAEPQLPRLWLLFGAGALAARLAIAGLIDAAN